MDVVGHVRRLEQMLIDTCAHFGVDGQRISGRSGVWVHDTPDRKIAAIGVRVARGVTMHGFALNVDCDLSAYDRIVPCGISDASVTSLSNETGRPTDITTVAETISPLAPHLIAANAGVRAVGTVAATGVWVLCWLMAPASWWLNERILDEAAFAASMQEVLQIEQVDTEITNRTTAQVLDDARAFVDRTVPLLSGQADTLLDRAEPAVAGLVNKAVNSQPGERAMLGLATQAHNIFLAWLDEDALGRPGLQADLDEGRATFDVDLLVAGQSATLGPVTIPLDALDLPGLTVPVPLPPDWMRVPINLLRSALLPAVIGIALAGIALIALDRGRVRALATASAITATGCAGAILLIRTSWTLSGADSADWTITRAIGELMVRPWITAYVWVIVGMVALAALGFVADRHRLVGRRPGA